MQESEGAALKRSERPVLPGDKIATIEEFVAGENALTNGDFVISKKVGIVSPDMKRSHQRITGEERRLQDSKGGGLRYRHSRECSRLDCSSENRSNQRSKKRQELHWYASCTRGRSKAFLVLVPSQGRSCNSSSSFQHQKCDIPLDD